MRVAVWPVVAGALVLLAPTARAQQQPPVIPVGVVVAAKEAVSRTSSFVGRIEAMERVDIRARVSGYLIAVDFKEGDRVHEGDPLFKIDPAPFQAAVQQAQGDLYRQQAEYTNATLQAERAVELARTSAGSIADRDKKVAYQKSAQGAVITADANLKTAQINLGYTVITAPITGIVGKTNFTRGNLIQPNTDILTTIVSTDPMYVSFPVSQREFLDIKRAEMQAGAAADAVTIKFSDGRLYDKPGTINFLDVKVDRATDTVLVRATIPNPGDVLIDGQLVTVLLEGEKQPDTILVPQSALLADQQGTYVFVAQDGKAEIRRVKVGGEKGLNAIIASGLDGGETVVVQGVESIRPGAAVLATPLPAGASGS